MYKIEEFRRPNADIYTLRSIVIMYHTRQILSFIIHDAMLAAVGFAGAIRRRLHGCSTVKTYSLCVSDHLEIRNLSLPRDIPALFSHNSQIFPVKWAS